MEYRETVRLRDGRECILRSAAEQDGAAALEVFIMTHGETDWLLSYPEEITLTPEQEAEYLKARAESRRELELLAEVDGKVVGTAGIDQAGSQEKLRHRATFGISILREYWGLGIGRAMTRACIRCAREAGYRQLELDAAAENRGAIALYESEGFVEYGRNPRGFLSRRNVWQELVLMRLELDGL